MRALVIGADGFVGRWLVQHLVEAGDEVTAAVGPRHRSADVEGMAAHPIDVTDAASVGTAVRAADPDAIYYLAGVSAPGARDAARDVISVSVIGAANTVAALAETNGRRRRLLHVGSSHMYGAPTAADPLTEAAPLAPTSVYGAAKAAAEAIVLHLAPIVGAEVVAVRAFNHAGPGQQPAFVIPALAEQVARIADGEGEPVVELGAADVERDFTDVRDVVRAYRLLMLRGVSGEAYNVASGHSVSIRQIAELLLRISGIEARLSTDPARIRTDDAVRIRGDATKLRGATGWHPEIPLRQTLADVLGDAQASRRAAAVVNER